MNLYFMRHTLDETELCMLEKKCLFHVETNENYFSIEEYIDVNRSPFVKYCIKNYISADSLEALREVICKEAITIDRFKVKYLDIDGSVEFDKRHEIEGVIGGVIIGQVNLSKPAIILGVTRLHGKWIMGEYLKSSAIWLENKNRPRGYCNALTNRVSRAILNIVVGSSINYKIIDPCCGVGTVVIEGLSMGLDIRGSDINANIVRGAKSNLRYFEYPEVIEVKDVSNITEHYDVAIVDLPYGILSIADKRMQLDIIKNAARICDKLALLGIDDILMDLLELGLSISDHCVIAKGNFKRNLYICNTL